MSINFRLLIIALNNPHYQTVPHGNGVQNNFFCANFGVLSGAKWYPSEHNILPKCKHFVILVGGTTFVQMGDFYPTIEHKNARPL
jgi:hypothetical protein